MNTNKERYLPCIPVLTLTLAVSLPAMLRVAQAAEFTPPDLEGFNQHDEREADGDGDGKNETVIKQYLNSNGDSIVSFTSNEQLWGWSMDTRDEDTGTRNYVIRDSNCDGVFDEVYSLDDEFHVPACVK